jgi:hypothetical protein
VPDIDALIACVAITVSAQYPTERATAYALPVTEHVCRTERHSTFYVACAAAEGTPIISCTAGRELEINWRHNLACFAR